MASRSTVIGRMRKNVKKALTFTLMVVGATGTGRTTFINTLCESAVLEHKQADAPDLAHEDAGIEIKPIQVELDEDGVRISLTVIDTPGFGDNIDNTACFKEIEHNLEARYDETLAQESRIKRDPRFRDNRVHCLLYFISPTGHSLREIDIELMRRLAPRVNIIPVIGKADTLTPSELAGFKARIMEDIEHYAIPIYNFPYDVEEDDEETIMDNSELRNLMPFALVGSEETFNIDGQAVRARSYPWGIVEVENPAHTDFLRLRTALLSTHLTDLKEITQDFLYENYRTEKLSTTDPYGTTGGSSIVGADGMQPENMDVRLKEQQLAKEEEKLREIELKVQRDIMEKRQELMAREAALKDLENRVRNSPQH